MGLAWSSARFGGAASSSPGPGKGHARRSLVSFRAQCACLRSWRVRRFSKEFHPMPASPAPPAVMAHGVSKRYGDLVAVDHVDRAVGGVAAPRRIGQARLDRPQRPAHPHARRPAPRPPSQSAARVRAPGAHERTSSWIGSATPRSRPAGSGSSTRARAPTRCTATSGSATAAASMAATPSSCSATWTADA